MIVPATLALVSSRRSAELWQGRAAVTWRSLTLSRQIGTLIIAQCLLSRMPGAMYKRLNLEGVIKLFFQIQIYAWTSLVPCWGICKLMILFSHCPSTVNVLPKIYSKAS